MTDTELPASAEARKPIKARRLTSALFNNGKQVSPNGNYRSTAAYGAYGALNSLPQTWYDEVRQCRWFYHWSPLCSTVVNRMAEMAVTAIKNNRNFSSDEEMAYYNFLAPRLAPLLRKAALVYLLDGLALPAYDTQQIKGGRLGLKTGDKSSRVRYTIPSKLWVRNNENIILRRDFSGTSKRVFLQVPSDEVYFIKSKGKYEFGGEDEERYLALVKNMPSYVAMVEQGVTEIPLDTFLIERKPLPYEDYPQPFLVPALKPLKRKARLEEMDDGIAIRAISAILHVKVGSDKSPAEEEELIEIEAAFSPRSDGNGTPEQAYAIFTDSRVSSEWIYPPLESLYSDTKYNEVNAELFSALGFSRILLVGETLRSNSAQSVTSTLGPIAALEEIQANLAEWVEWLYEEMAERNGFENWPRPEFTPISSSEQIALIQNAILALQAGVLSQDFVASLYGTDFETQQRQREAEQGVTGLPANPVPVDIAPTDTSPPGSPSTQQDKAVKKTASRKRVTAVAESSAAEG